MKGIIKTITHKGKWATVTLSNGEYTDKPLTGNSEFDARFSTLKPGDEIDFEVKNDKYINLTKDKKAFGAGKDWTFEKKKAALEASVNLVSSGKVEAKDVLKSADKFFDWLNKK